MIPLPRNSRIFAALVCVMVLCACQSRPTHEIEKVSVPGNAGAAKALALQRDGAELLAKGKLAEARQLFQQAVDADPSCGPAHNDLGSVYFRQGDLYQAAWEFQYAAKLMGARPEPENNLGLVFERAGKLDDAITHYTKAFSLAPDKTEVLGNLVRARIRHGDKDVSLQEQLQKLVLQETRPQWLAWAKQELALIADRQASPTPRDDLPKPEPANIFVPLNKEHSP